MSVFLKNTCPFSKCPTNFKTLSDLIIHIENEHLDFDPKHIQQLEEEKPDNISLSYVLKFGDCRPEISNQAVIEDWEDAGATEVPAALNKNKLETRLSLDEISQLLGSSNLFVFDNNHKKPFACNMKGCEKRYKNANGIKYHYKNHHNVLLPNFKKSVLKHKIGANCPKIKIEEVANEYYAHNRTTSRGNEVPLHPTSFNYYVKKMKADCENFPGRSSHYFVPSFGRHLTL